MCIIAGPLTNKKKTLSTSSFRHNRVIPSIFDIIQSPTNKKSVGLFLFKLRKHKKKKTMEKKEYSHQYKMRVDIKICIVSFIY